MKIVLPSQGVNIDTPTGIEPIWYEKLQAMNDQLQIANTQLQALTAFMGLFEIDLTTIADGDVLIWNAAQQKFLPGAN